ncbi:MAG: peptidoglycan DD-metalloendopeptidase family protein [Bacteroidota bacterium]
MDLRPSLFLSLCLMLLLVACQTETQQTDQITEQISDKNIHSSNPLYSFLSDTLEVMEATIQPRENLGEILNRFHVSAATIHQVATLPRETFDSRRLQVNKPYTVFHEKDSTASCFIYHPNPIDYVALKFGDSLEVVHGQHKVDTVVHTLSGTINSSLYVSVLEAGGTPQLVSEIADIYAWVIDFFGLQGGDCFKVIYTTLEVNGAEAGFGRIIASEFYHMDDPLYAFTFDQGNGLAYYDEVGNSLRKNFLKAPLNYTRISSRFSYSRLHPILKIRRPHLGVDYAAPRGTPVLSVGDGVVTKAAYSGGAGRMIKVKHNSNYETAYLHLYKYAKGIKPGVKVTQGQVIGYVGSTGLSTGPHLDFRFYKNGVPIDPLKVEPVPTEPIDSLHLDRFMEQMEIYKSQLQEVDKENPTLYTMKEEIVAEKS